MTWRLSAGTTGVQGDRCYTGRLSARVAEAAQHWAWGSSLRRFKGADSSAVLQLASPLRHGASVSSGDGRVSRFDLFTLRQQLSGRDKHVLEHVSQFRLLCARQVQALLFPPELHATPATAARCCRRVLERLTRERLVVRLERRVGGARSGSASFIYALTSLGQRVLDQGGPRRRLAEPSARFVDHTLAVAEFFVQLSLHARGGACELLSWQSEPSSWRDVMTLGGRVVLRPDFFVTLGVEGFELRWFVEIDRGSEHLPAISRKCRLYHSYYKSGSEQHHHKVFPRVLFIVPHERRAEQLRAAIAADRRLTAGLFHVTTDDQALTTIGETP